MRWQGRKQSTNVEDRRGARVGLPGGRRSIPMGCGSIIILLIALYLGKPDLALQILGNASQGAPSSGQASQPRQRQGSQAPPNNDEARQFVGAILADTEETWHAELAKKGIRYPEPVVVIFSDAVRSQCGIQSSQVGPFYCPLDHKVYIDPTFYDELARRHNAPGDFAQAYVLAHEVGHHVQNVMGVSEKVHALRGRMSEAEANKLSVMQELQADCYAGVWGNHAKKYRNLLEPGDIDEAIQAANAIGDDTLQKQARGYVIPERFTHGSAAQRQRWFKIGFESGTMDSCDTFNAPRL